MTGIKPLYVLLLCIMLLSSVQGQSLLSASAELGYFPFHSDNSLPITKEGKFAFHYGANVSLQSPLFSDYSFLIDFGYFQATINRANSFSFTSVNGPSQTTLQYLQITQRSFPIDISILPNRFSGFAYSLGLCAVYSNREVDIPYLFHTAPLVDRFNSIGVGATLGFRLLFPLDASNRYALLCSAKLRYVHSIWFDSAGRDLSGYQLNFFQSLFSLGVAYSLK